MLPKFLKKIEEKNKLFSNCLNFFRKIRDDNNNKKIERKAKKRAKGYLDKRYIKLKEFDNLYFGERCFIIATGPSLTFEDLEKLKSEYTFSMNSLCLAYDKTSFRPTFYGIQDEYVYDKLKDTLNKNESPKTIRFISSNIIAKREVSKDWIAFPLNIDYHVYDERFNKKYFANFSNNSYSIVYDGYTITYSLIQLAVYMGFKEIYLLGCDCNYSADKNKQHFIESGHYDPRFNEAKDKMTIAYKEAKKHADMLGVKIFNATRGGMLEVFPRVDLDEVISVEHKTNV